MSISGSISLVKKIVKVLWKTINTTRKVFLNVLFFGVLAVILFSVGDGEPKIIEDSSALRLNLAGVIVDQKTFVDPWQSVLTKSSDSDKNSETLLSDVLKVINTAATDPRVSALVLDLSQLSKVDLSKLQTIGHALAHFKKLGKPIIANGNFYNQQQYYLASFANKIYLNPEGGVMLNGFANYRLFFKSALDKLDIETHVFRVGSFKSAVEPYIRDDMSVEAKEANLSLMNDLWQSYATVVSANRNVKADDLALSAEKVLTELDKAKGKTAQMAINMGWVDKLATFDEFNQDMVAMTAKSGNGHSYRRVNFKDYLAQIPPDINLYSDNNVGLITAKGMILNGKQQAGSIGGDSTAELLRKARFDNEIKAVVLRIDSPGGSAFASEQIRQELLALKAAGKPVVVSMGNIAASGGYWIAANADYIYATPTTITGSIGIFGMFATFEKSLKHLGIHSDGVATTDWAGLTVLRPLSPQVAAVIQRHVDRGYQDFIELVANARHKTVLEVDQIAQGRVWTGKQALKLGLVDDLGELSDAINQAAKLAKLDHYDVINVEPKLTTEQMMMQEIFSSLQSYLPELASQSSPLQTLYAKWTNSLSEYSAFDDPQGIYLFCDMCNQ